MVIYSKQNFLAGMLFVSNIAQPWQQTIPNTEVPELFCCQLFVRHNNSNSEDWYFNLCMIYFQYKCMKISLCNLWIYELAFISQLKLHIH